MNQEGGVAADQRIGAAQALRRCMLFSRVDDEALARCAGSLRSRRYRRNETIFHQGDPGDSLYVIESGAGQDRPPGSRGRGGGDHRHARDRATSSASWRLLDGEEHSATAVALEATEALVLRREAFDRLVDEDPNLRRALFAGLVGELRRLTHHVGELHFLNLPGRLAQRIVRMAREADPSAQGEVRLSWPFSQSELAAMIGGTRQTVNRLLADFTAEGLIRIEKETLVVTDLERLERAAER